MSVKKAQKREFINSQRNKKMNEVYKEIKKEDIKQILGIKNIESFSRDIKNYLRDIKRKEIRKYLKIGSGRPKKAINLLKSIEYIC